MSTARAVHVQRRRPGRGLVVPRRQQPGPPGHRSRSRPRPPAGRHGQDGYQQPPPGGIQIPLAAQGTEYGFQPASYICSPPTPSSRPISHSSAEPTAISAIRKWSGRWSTPLADTRRRQDLGPGPAPRIRRSGGRSSCVPIQREPRRKLIHRAGTRPAGLMRKRVPAIRPVRLTWLLYPICYI
jgi:hypothetical protein